jgi:hypothetical protein
MEKDVAHFLRREYVVPMTEVIRVKMNSILCGSNEGVDEIPGSW